MKGNGFDIEQIEEYLLDRLSAADKKAIEAAIQKDPLLASEVEVQKDIIKSIQNFRKAELKARLNKVEVPSSGWSMYSRIAASVLLLGAGVAIFWFSTTSPESKKIEKQIAVSTPAEIQKAEKEISTLPMAESPASQTAAEPASPVADKPVKQKAEKQRNLVINTPSVPEPNEDFDLGDKNISVPEGNVSGAVESRIKNIEVEIHSAVGKTPQYQYYNNKLFLFGDFNSSPYDIMELNSPRAKELYLFFDGEYYKLNQNVMEKTDLKKIRDFKLKTQLESMRSK
jgi:hypothetical protein